MKEQRFAGTYADLQGISIVEALWDTTCSRCPTPMARAAATYWLSAAVAATHAGKLLADIPTPSTRSTRKKLERLLGWALSFLQIRRQLLERAGWYIEGDTAGAERVASLSWDAQVSSGLAHATQQILKLFPSGDSLRRTVASGGIDQERCRTLHWMRHATYLDTISAHRSSRYLPAVSMRGDPRLASIAPQLSELLIHPTNRDAESLAAFRGLHQVPECLALSAIDCLDAALASSHQAERSRLLVCASDSVELMIACLNGLALQLTPRAYHEIRAFLGETSGSQSVSIARRLLREKVAALANNLHVPDWQTSRPELLRFLSLTRAWRDLHLLFPLLYLGTSGTRSLVGAPDATTAVIRMRDGLVGHDGIATPSGATYPAITSGIEESVQPALSAITQGRFPDIQNRTGFYARRGKT